MISNWWVEFDQKRQVPSDIKHKFQLAYRKWPVDEHDDMRGWHLGLVDAPGVIEGDFLGVRG